MAGVPPATVSSLPFLAPLRVSGYFSWIDSM
jgi:hypothetical protein